MNLTPFLSQESVPNQPPVSQGQHAEDRDFGRATAAFRRSTRSRRRSVSAPPHGEDLGKLNRREKPWVPCFRGRRWFRFLAYLDRPRKHEGAATCFRGRRRRC